MEQEGRKDGGFQTQMQSGRIRSALAECVKDPDSWKEQVNIQSRQIMSFSDLGIGRICMNMELLFSPGNHDEKRFKHMRLASKL